MTLLLLLYAGGSVHRACASYLCSRACAAVPVQPCLCSCACAAVPVQPCLCIRGGAAVFVQLWLRNRAGAAVSLQPCHCKHLGPFSPFCHWARQHQLQRQQRRQLPMLPMYGFIYAALMVCYAFYAEVADADNVWIVMALR